MLCLMKTFTEIGGFLTLLIGLGMLAVTIYAFTREAATFHQYEFLIILTVADVLIILASVLGIIGVKRQKGVLIFIFQIMIMLFFAVFLTIGIFAVVIPKNIYNESCTGNTNSFVNTFYESYENAEAQFCHTTPCGLTNKAITTSNYSLNQQNTLNNYNKSDSAPINYQNTP